MTIFVAILLLILVVILANLIDLSQNKNAHRLFAGLFLVAHLLLGSLAALLLLNPASLPQMSAFGIETIHPTQLALALLVVALWGILVTISAVRRMLARILPVNPDSAVHMLALLLSGWLVGNTLLTLALGGMEALGDSAEIVTIFDVLLQQFGFVLLAFTGAGLILRRTWPQTLQRLGLERPTAAHMRLGFGWMLALLAIQWAIGLLWLLIDPEQAELLGSVNEALLGNIDSLLEWFLLAAAAGIGEEILFRGALQPVLGLGFTSLLFAIVHVQYGFTPITLAVLIIGLALGILRNRTNTTTTILVHFGYNFTLGLLSLAAAALQQYVP